ncbi:Ankyrin repeat protein 1 [Giardia muris]|uniref:Ankyrin repeat protein 1 n=1 Tax=Giardia muris TaxID=5742 RepID=A0A4Z1SU23_GIAMU|nr:Ankyrin repeat protein 1 [Giardia muris]|eukprot:TNJ27118.1 Ankyrin repeat protein 1 [Giardia muris]
MAQTDVWFDAVTAGNEERVRALIPSCARLYNAAGETALMVATRAFNSELVALLTPHESCILSSDGLTALGIAASIGNAAACKLLVKREGLIKLGNGRTPLILAAQAGQLKCARIVAAHHPAQRDAFGRTALDYAIQCDNLPIANMLVGIPEVQQKCLSQAVMIARGKGMNALAERLMAIRDTYGSLPPSAETTPNMAPVAAPRPGPEVPHVATYTEYSSDEHLRRSGASQKSRSLTASRGHSPSLVYRRGSDARSPRLPIEQSVCDIDHQLGIQGIRQLLSLRGLGIPANLVEIIVRKLQHNNAEIEALRRQLQNIHRHVTLSPMNTRSNTPRGKTVSAHDRSTRSLTPNALHDTVTDRHGAKTQVPGNPRDLDNATAPREEPHIPYEDPPSKPSLSPSVDYGEHASTVVHMDPIERRTGGSVMHLQQTERSEVPASMQLSQVGLSGMERSYPHVSDSFKFSGSRTQVGDRTDPTEEISTQSDTCALLRSYLEIDEETLNSNSDLMNAVLDKSIEDVQALVGAEKGVQNAQGRTALMYATETNFLDAAAILAPHEARIVDNHGITALMIATRLGNLQIMQMLLVSEATMVTHAQRTALMIAARFNQPHGAALLLDYEAGRTDIAGNTALHIAARYNHAEVARVIAPKEGGILSQDDETALMIAARHGHTEAVRALLPYEHHRQNNRGRTCLMELAICGWNVPSTLLDALIKGEACDVSADGVMAIEFALRNKHYALAERLTAIEGTEAVPYQFRNYAEPGLEATTELIQACREGDLVAAYCLRVQYAASLRCKEDPIHIALKHGHHDIAEMLRDVVVRNTQPQTSGDVSGTDKGSEMTTSNSGIRDLLETLTKHNASVHDDEWVSDLIVNDDETTESDDSDPRRHPSDSNRRTSGSPHSASQHTLHDGSLPNLIEKAPPPPVTSGAEESESSEYVPPPPSDDLNEGPRLVGGIPKRASAISVGYENEIKPSPIPFSMTLSQGTENIPYRQRLPQDRSYSSMTLSHSYEETSPPIRPSALRRQLQHDHVDVAEPPSRDPVRSHTRRLSGDDCQDFLVIQEESPRLGPTQDGRDVDAVTRQYTTNLNEPKPRRRRDSNVNQNTALMQAVIDGDAEAAANLLDEARRVNRLQQTALMLACERNRPGIAEMLVDAEAGMMCRSFEMRYWKFVPATALMIAGMTNAVECIEILADREAKMTDNIGKTALMGAAFCGHLRAVRLLMRYEYGMKTRFGTTALMIATRENKVSVVEELKGLEAGSIDANGMTAFMTACERGFTDCMNILAPLEAGRVVRKNEDASEQFTGLTVAALSGNFRCVAGIAPYEAAEHGETTIRALSGSTTLDQEQITQMVRIIRRAMRDSRKINSQ